MSFNPVLKRLLLTPFNLLYRIDPVLNARLLYRLKTGETLHLDPPVTFNEKLQWLKLYDRNPLLPRCVDKYTVREYVAQKGLGGILNELLWEGFDPDAIPYDRLPDSFVIKVTHGSGFNILCRDKAALDRAQTAAKLRRWLKEKYIPCYGEWFYGKVRPRIIVEALLHGGDGAAAPDDYKVFCFNGVPRYISVDTGRFTDRHYKNIYDTDWNLLRDHQLSYRCSNQPIPSPPCLDRLLEYARVLSGDFIQARVDFFVVDGAPVFGEITFCHGAGFDIIRPPEFAREMGDCLKLPTENGQTGRR